MPYRDELQYVGARLAKVNYVAPMATDGLKPENISEYLLDHPEYVYLLIVLGKSRAITSLPYTLSLKGGKLTAYGGYEKDRSRVFESYSLKYDPKIHRYFSQSFVGHSDTLKVYENDLFYIPYLPKGSELRIGVARSYSNAGQVGNVEVFFWASDENMRQWVKKHRLGFFVPGSAYYGISFKALTPIGPVKSCIRPEPQQYSEDCWVSGEKIRAGFNPESRQGKELLSRVPKVWTQLPSRIRNVGSNYYEVDSGEKVEVISIYYNGDPPPQHLLDQFSVPVKNVPPWWGIKYAPKYGWVWLKIADMTYEAFDFPELPEGAVKGFGIASVFPLSAEQPKQHSTKGTDWVDISFITKDHGSVREYCRRMGIDDPNPNLPDQLSLWGIYSLTLNKATGKIWRMKYYSYHGKQKYAMEMYAEDVVNGLTEESSFDCLKRVFEHG